MSEILFVYTNQQRRSDVAAALGGEVWFNEHKLHWRPKGHNKTITIGFRDLSEPFDGDEYAAALWSAWDKAGARL